jgi:hypothetical protein
MSDVLESVDEWVRESARSMAPGALLTQPVTDLQGVTTQAAGALSAVGIHSLLDLAASALFALARQVVDAVEGRGPLHGLPVLPSDLLDDAARRMAPAAVAHQGLEVLRPIDPVQARMLEEALPAPTVRDLALWPPSRHARRILQIAYGATDAAADPEAPEELQPRMGRQPVERVTYQQLLFEGPVGATPPPPPDGGHERPKFDGIDGAIDLTAALLGQGFQLPAFGIRLTIAQTWTPVGLALGHLLHSVALAPGEATRIAVIDWSRTVASGTSEQIAEDEMLAATLGRKRSLTEVTNAVANETQKGRTDATETAASWGIGGGAAGSHKAVTAAVGFGYSRTDSKGSVVTNSQGQRNVAADMTQNVQDRTEQNASLARGRRASIVSEVSVREAERLSTRVVANYNHMHALSVLYFEIVHIYRTRTEVVDAEPLLYLPIQQFDFRNKEIVERFRALLAEVALNEVAQDALLGIERQTPEQAQRVGSAGMTTYVLLGRERGAKPLQRDQPLDADELRSALGPSAVLTDTELRVHSKEAVLTEIQAGPLLDEVGRVRGMVFSALAVDGRAGSETLGFREWAKPRDNYAGVGVSYTPYRVQLGEQQRRPDVLRSVTAEKGSGVGAQACRVIFVFHRVDADGKPVGDPVQIEATYSVADQASRVDLVRVNFAPDIPTTGGDRRRTPRFDLVQHLQVNALHYTMAILRRADPALLGTVLGTITVGGVPLLAQVDPQPVARVANYLVFRWSAAQSQRWWDDLLDERGLSKPSFPDARREALVPMPTGGVFAEAVLGRFNSAEKLDLTRFWNWQDSPIPLTPPEIAPLQAGGRQGATAPTPSELGAAVLGLRDAPSIPDPTGVITKALEIAGKGDTFRDMSAAGPLLTQIGEAAKLSAQGATKFMETAMSTVTAYGGRLNEAKKLDEAEQKAAAKDAAAKPGAGAPGGGTPGGGGTPPPPGGVPGPGSAGPKPRPAGSTASPVRRQTEVLQGPGGSEPETPEASTKPIPLQISVAIERRDRSDETSARVPLAVDGELVISGWPIDTSGMALPGGGTFVPPSSLAGEARVPIRSGTGSGQALLEPGSPSELAGDPMLAIRRLAGLPVRLGGDRLPGLSESWDYTSLPDILAAANRVWIAGRIVNRSSGSVRMRVGCEVRDRVSVQAAVTQLRGEADGEAAGTVPTKQIDIGQFLTNGSLVGDAEHRLTAHLMSICELADERSEILERAALPGLLLDLSVVFGAELTYRSATTTIEASFPWVLLHNCRMS